MRAAVSEGFAWLVHTSLSFGERYVHYMLLQAANLVEPSRSSRAWKLWRIFCLGFLKHGRSATKNKIPSTEIQVIRERRVVSSWENTSGFYYVFLHDMFLDKKASRLFRPERQISLIFYDLRFSLVMMASRIVAYACR